jgi:hypothetical protein
VARKGRGDRAPKRPETAPRGGAAKRRGYQRRSPWERIALRVGIAAVVVLSVAVIANEAGFFRPSAGVVMPDQGRGHVPPGTRVSYDSIPPTSGSHYEAQVAPWGSYQARVEDAIVVHNLEHGGIAIAYKGISDADVERLEGFLRTFAPSRFGNRVKIVIHPDDRLNDGEIVLTAWTRMDRLTAIDEQRIRTFYDAHLDRCCEKVP